MTRLPTRERKRLWQLPDPTLDYVTARREGPGTIVVLHHGRHELHRQSITPNDTATYLVVDGWLVEESYPRWEAKDREDQAKRRANVARDEAREHEQRASLAAAAARPAFKNLLRELTSSLGRPEVVTRVGGVTLHWFSPPKKRLRAADAAQLFARVRAAGAVATVRHHGSTAGRSSDSVVVFTGSMAELTSHVAFWARWKTHRARRALASLDRDAGLQLERVSDDGFVLVLDRVPTKLAAHAARLGAVSEEDPDAIATALARRRWRHHHP